MHQQLCSITKKNVFCAEEHVVPLFGIHDMMILAYIDEISDELDLLRVHEYALWQPNIHNCARFF